MLKCPKCRSVFHDIVACWGGDGDLMEELCICDDCSTQFIATYEYTSIRIDEAQEIG